LPLHWPGAPVGRRYGRCSALSRHGAGDHDEPAARRGTRRSVAGLFTVPERDTAREWIGSVG